MLIDQAMVNSNMLDCERFSLNSCKNFNFLLCHIALLNILDYHFTSSKIILSFHNRDILNFNLNLN